MEEWQIHLVVAAYMLGMLALSVGAMAIGLAWNAYDKRKREG